MRRVLPALLALAVALATLILLAPATEAAWNPAGERGEASFELIPQEGKVHATLTYHVQNLDPDTMSNRSSYSSWGVSLPRDARNIRVYERTAPLTFTLEQSSERWSQGLVNFNERLYYDVSYAFTVEYDLPGMTSSVASFYAYGNTYLATVKIIIPLGYSVQLQQGYSLTTTPTHQVYTYSLTKDGARFSTEVLALRRTAYQTLSATAPLRNKSVTITVEYWEGERAKAEYILNLYRRALPLLEEITSIPFPRPYQNIVVKEVTYEDTKGSAGVNSGAAGIRILASRMGDSSVLLHELAHYWVREPPFAEDWYEGFDELYAYLALKKLGLDSEAEDMKRGRFRDYERFKNQFNLPLAQWVNAPGVSDIDLFGYAKSFVFALGLYEKLGLAALQKFNGEAFAASRSLNWVEYISLLTKTTGQDQAPLFAGWVTPGVTQTLGTSYEKWQQAEKAYREAEVIVSKSKGALGIGEVLTALEQARSLLTKGSYEEVLTRVSSALKLYEGWQRAEKAYREAEQSISKNKGAVGIGEVEKALDLALSLLTKGQYDAVAGQAQAALKLFTRWQEAEKAYREAEQTISKSKGALGIGEVEKALDMARSLLTKGQYDVVPEQAQAALKLFARWQEAEKAYREAEQTIIKSKGALGISIVESQLQAARDMLISSDFGRVLPQIQTTQQLYQRWQRAEQAYRQVERALAPYRGALGLETVEKDGALARDLLAEGQFEKTQAQSQSTLKLFEKWAAANIAHTEAVAAVSLAKKEGRTWHLKNAEVTLGQSTELLRSSKFEEAAAGAQQARDGANRAVTPLRGIAPFVIPLAVAIGIVRFLLLIKRMKTKPAQG